MKKNIKQYLTNIGRRGGSSKSKKKIEAVTKNLEKANKARKIKLSNKEK